MEIFMLIWIFVTLVLCVFVQYHWSRRKLYLFASKVSGAFAFPIIGNGLNFLCHRDDFLNSLDSIMGPYASPVRVWLGPKLCVIVKDADQLQIVMSSPKMAEKGFVYKFAVPFLGRGLFTSSSAVSKSHRKILQPFFSQKNVDGFSGIFQKHANNLVNDVAPYVDGPEFDISPFTQQAALGSTMDVLIEDQSDGLIDLKEIPKQVKKFYEIFFTRITNFWLHSDFVFKRTARYREQAEMKEVADAMINEVLTVRLPEIEEKIKRGETISNDRAPSLLCLFAEINQQNPNQFSIQDCVDHVMTFMATSQDTQGTIVAFTCMILGAYPDVQTKIVQELREVLGSRTTLDFTDVSQMKYLEMVLKETLRLFPVAPFILRHTTEDFKLNYLTLPKDSTVFLSIYHVHRDPTHWERPNEFYPEHFTLEAVTKRHPFAFIPYSAGPRRCPAREYAYASMKIALSTLLMNYEIECRQKVADIKLTTDLHARPVGGHMVKLKKRYNDTISKINVNHNDVIGA